MPSLHAPSAWLSTRLCPAAASRVAALTRRVERLSPALAGPQSHILRYALFVAVLSPPLPAALRERCPRGKSVSFRAAPLVGREGDAFAVALRILPSCFPEGTMHGFVEHGLQQGEEIVRLLCRADHTEREALFDRVVGASIYDLRPSLAARYDL